MATFTVLPLTFTNGDFKYTTISENSVEVTSFSGSGYADIPSMVSHESIDYVVSAIGNRAFYESMISEISIPNSVTFIDIAAFMACKNLESVILPDNLTFIGHSAFSECSLLSSISIPNSVSFI